MASGVGGAGGASGPNRYSNKNEGEGDNLSSGNLGEHKLSSDFESARKNLERHFRQENPGRTSPGGGKTTSPNKGVKHALKNIWDGVKGAFGRKEKPKLDISDPQLPGFVKLGVRSPGLEEIKVKFHRGSEGEPHIVVEKKEGGSSGEVEEVPGGGPLVSETGSNNSSQTAAGASGFKGALQSGAKGMTNFAERVGRIFSDKPGRSGESGSVITSRSESSGIVANEPTGPVTGLTLQEMLEVEQKLSDLIGQSTSGARRAQLKKWKGSVERDRKRLTGSGGVNREEPLDVIGCSDAELQHAVAEGLAIEDAIRDLDRVLDDASREVDSEVSEPEKSSSERSVRTQESLKTEQVSSSGVDRKGTCNFLRRLLATLLRLVLGFLRSAYRKVRTACQAAMEWIRRTCPCTRGKYEVIFSEDDRELRTAQWVERHFGSGRDGIVLSEETVNRLSEGSSLGGDDGIIERYFRDFQRLIEDTEKKDIAPTSKAVNVLRIFTSNISDWLPSVGFSK
ncbi:hypothetical protein [Chlamydia pecorum]|uniref:hypothetical protein n=1 Tax=Chlamydia pecorum TaxID=85991 RepID=UPI0003D3E456|nr:hypothetical protein [Chlamydia pecorum]ETF37839.1 hypothetical protein CpecS_0530 [Chlamydia pecorum VR629]